MSVASPRPTSKAAYALLGAMSAITFVGPFALAWLLSGGERRGWPPDRTVEWVGAIGLFAAFAIVFAACLTVRMWLLKPEARLAGEEYPSPLEGEVGPKGRMRGRPASRSGEGPG